MKLEYLISTILQCLFLYLLNVIYVKEKLLKIMLG